MTSADKSITADAKIILIAIFSATCRVGIHAADQASWQLSRRLPSVATTQNLCKKFQPGQLPEKRRAGRGFLWRWSTPSKSQPFIQRGCPYDGTAPRHKRWVTTLGHENGQKLRPLEPRNLALAADLELEGARRVEAPAIFVGQSAELRARDYYDAIERGALNTRIADAQIVTPKTALSFAQKRRRPVR